MRLHALILLGIISIPLSSSCNESKFGGSAESAASAPAPNKESSPPTSSKSGGEDCVDGDTITLKWSGPTKECLDDGKTYNFDEERCMEMRKSAFECNWSNVKSEMKKIGLSSKLMEADSEAGAKLVSCGQSEDNNRIVVQWINAPTGGTFDCKEKATKGNIVTGCYTFYKSEDDMPPAATTAEERSKQVFECMNSL